MKDRVPLGRFGSPDELADLASVLLMPRQQVKALMEQLRPD